MVLGCGSLPPGPRGGGPSPSSPPPSPLLPPTSPLSWWLRGPPLAAARGSLLALLPPAPAPAPPPPSPPPPPPWSGERGRFSPAPKHAKNRCIGSHTKRFRSVRGDALGVVAGSDVGTSETSACAMAREPRGVCRSSSCERLLLQLEAIGSFGKRRRRRTCGADDAWDSTAPTASPPRCTSASASADSRASGGGGGEEALATARPPADARPLASSGEPRRMNRTVMRRVSRSVMQRVNRGDPRRAPATRRQRRLLLGLMTAPSFSLSSSLPSSLPSSSVVGPEEGQGGAEDDEEPPPLLLWRSGAGRGVEVMRCASVERGVAALVPPLLLDATPCGWNAGVVARRNADAQEALLHQATRETHPWLISQHVHALSVPEAHCACARAQYEAQCSAEHFSHTLSPGRPCRPRCPCCPRRRAAVSRRRQRQRLRAQRRKKRTRRRCCRCLRCPGSGASLAARAAQSCSLRSSERGSQR